MQWGRERSVADGAGEFGGRVTLPASGGPGRARAQVESLLEDDPTRLAHVRSVASRLAATAPLAPDWETLITAAWLHDIGYAKSIRRTGLHALDGALWLQSQGWDSQIVALVGHHSGAVNEAAVRGEMEEFEQLPRPDQTRLDLLTWADMTTSPDGESVSVEDRLQEILQRYPDDDPVSLAVRRSTPGLTATVERVEKWLRESGQPM